MGDRDERDFTSRTVVITGGTSGIGRATALQFRNAGANVFVGDVAVQEASVAKLTAVGIVVRQCDVRVEADVQCLIESAVERTGRLDVMCNNAGVGLIKPITEVTEAEWDFVLDTNFKGVFFGCKHAIRHMQNARGGCIVNTASNAGLLPRGHDPVYSISKQAVVGLTKSLALCHAHQRIRINAVCPGPVDETRMMDDQLQAAADPHAERLKYIAASPAARGWGRMISPDEIAASILYLASDAATMITGTCIAIDGGKSLGVPPRD